MSEPGTSTKASSTSNTPSDTVASTSATTTAHVKNEGRGDDDDDDDDDALNHDNAEYSNIPTYTGMTLKERRELYGNVYEKDDALWDDIQKYVVDVAILPTDQPPRRKRVKMSMPFLEQTTDATTTHAESQKDCNNKSNSQKELLSQSSSLQKDAGQSSSSETTITASNAAAATANGTGSLTVVAVATATAASIPASGTIVTRQQALMSTDIWGRFPPKEPKDMISCPSCSRPINTLRLASHLDKCMLGKTRG